jgi:hypothetical protein
MDDLGSHLLKKGKIKVAIQLVSIIPSCKEDVVGTFHAIAQIGYKRVEFATGFGGFYGKTPGEMQKVLDEYRSAFDGSSVVAIL